MPKYYRDVNTHKPKEYWDYENHEFEWGYFSIRKKILFLNIKYIFIEYCVWLKNLQTIKNYIKSNHDEYEIIKKIGRGKYSDVYTGISSKTN